MNHDKSIDKKLIYKRLGIYLLIAFGLVWIPTFLYFGTGHPYADFSTRDIYPSPGASFLLAYCMLCPTIAVLAARKLTGEGIYLTETQAQNHMKLQNPADDSQITAYSLRLGIYFKNGKWKWLLLAILFPTIYFTLGELITLAIFPQCFDPSKYQESGFGLLTLLLFPVAGIIDGIVLSVGGLGEEIGWRTYLYPKLEQLFGLKKAVLLGGVIWSIWHWPAIYYGHNFGKGYWGDPYTGFAAFTLFCIADGILLYFVVRKTGSVWSAAFLHAINNCNASPLRLFINPGKLSGIFAESPVYTSLILSGTLVVAAVVLFLPEKFWQDK